MESGLVLEDVKSLNELFKFVAPIATFVLGFLVSRFTMTKKERTDYQTLLVDTARDLSNEHAKAFQDFAQSLHVYANKSEDPDLDDFFNVATKGELYFNQMKITCDAIIAERVDEDSIKNTIYPKVKDTIDRILPNYYDSLNEIAEKKGIAYTGELKQENYKSIYTVYDRYA